MLSLLMIINVIIMAMLFGYAFACTMVVHPAMMDTSRPTAVEFFKPFFHKSAHMQMVLSVVVLVISLIISLLGGSWWWFIGAVIMQLSGPYTLKILMPVNNRIMEDGADINSEQMTKDLSGWGKLHFPRTVMAASIFILFTALAVAH